MQVLIELQQNLFSLTVSPELVDSENVVLTWPLTSDLLIFDYQHIFYLKKSIFGLKNVFFY